MKFLPDYRRSSGNRTKIGDWLVRHLPVLIVLPSGKWELAMMGAKHNHCFVRRVMARKTPWGYAVGRILIQTQPWALSRQILHVGRIYIGRG